MKRTPLRANPVKVREWIQRSRKPLNKTGKRYKKRQAMNARLNKTAATLGIDRCEIKIEGRCVSRIQLTWAHALKSRFLLTDADWQRAARCCMPCHDFIESLSHGLMANHVDNAIARRVDILTRLV